jgi:hypothetical protein
MYPESNHLMRTTYPALQGGVVDSKQGVFSRVFLFAAVLAVLLAFTGCPSPASDPLPAPVPPTVWTAIDGFGTATIQKVVYGRNKFVATGNGGTAWVSSDGITWTAAADSAALGSSNISGLGVGGGNGSLFGSGASGIFFAAGGSSNNKDWAYSTDGTTWTATGDAATNFNAKGLAYGNGKYLIGGSNGRIALASSVKGPWVTYDADATSFNAAGKNGFVNAMVFGRGIFVAAGSNYGHAAYSADGQTWAPITQTETIFNNWINGIAYGSERFVAVGQPAGRAAYSNIDDPENWTQVDDIKISADLYTVAFGSRHFVAGGADGTASYSADGITWTAIADTKFGGSAINGIAYGSGRFVMVGAGGKASWSNSY